MCQRVICVHNAHSDDLNVRFVGFTVKFRQQPARTQDFLRPPQIFLSLYQPFTLLDSRDIFFSFRFSSEIENKQKRRDKIAANHNVIIRWEISVDRLPKWMN